MEVGLSEYVNLLTEFRLSQPQGRKRTGGKWPVNAVANSQSNYVSFVRWRVELPKSSITLQRLFLRGVAHPLNLLVPHLNNGDLVAPCDTDRYLLAPDLNLL